MASDALALQDIEAFYGDSQTAHFFCVLDLDVTVAKGKQPFAGYLGLTQDPLNYHLFGKALVIIFSAINMRSEIAGNVQ